MKFIKLCLLFGTLVLLNSCRKEDPRPENTDVQPQRDRIMYSMTIVPRADNRVGDTLIVKVNGIYADKANTANPPAVSIFPTKGSVVDKYGTYYVYTGDVLEVHYYPGKVTYHGTQMLDENGLAIYLDYNVNNNMLLKEFACRCVGNYTVTIP